MRAPSQKFILPVIADAQAVNIVKAVPKTIPVQFEFPNLGLKPQQLVSNLLLHHPCPQIPWLRTAHSQTKH